MPDTRLTLLDLFCGAGGLSLGFIRAGFSVLAAIDNKPAAIDTYRSNLGPHAGDSDLLKDVELPRATVVAGGPPCQGFSSAGMRRSGDRRNSLVGRFANTISKLRPEAFVFENVEGFLTAEDGAYVFELLAPLLEAGYQIHLRKINAANYGVPQHRKRVIAIGGLGWEPFFPMPTHTAFGAPGALLATRHLPPTPSVGEVLADLPDAATDLPGIPQGHFYRPLEGVDLERAMALKPGETMRDLPEELHHESYRRRANRRVMDGTPTEKRGGAPAGIRRLRADEPAKAITGGARSEFLHPSENRTLTIRESARLQTFPDDFVFLGNPSEQTQLIGNAVPPRLASIIATSVAEGLRGARKIARNGAILSFVPTLSEGYSPALRHVMTAVRREFESYLEAEELFLWR
jgi:DNA (cytosine-5)-methyltransferase 1